MEFKEYVRVPFEVKAVQITAENIDQIAPYIGDLKIRQDDQVKYILVDRRMVPNVPNGFKVYIGYYMTKIGENVRCYSNKIFNEQFAEKTPDLEPWLEFMKEQSRGSV